MSDELEAALGPRIRRLVSMIGDNPELVSELRQLAQEFLKLTAPAEAGVGESGAAERAAETVADTGAEGAVATAPPPRHEPLPGVPGVEVPIGWAQRLSVSHADLKLIETRCRLKAEGARWAATRQRRINEGATFDVEIEPIDREIIARAKVLEDCFLWMNHPSSPIPYDLQLWEDVAGCFEATAMVVAVLQSIMDDVKKSGTFLERALDLAAEAQSALRMAVEAVDGKPDGDQQKVYHWLRQTAAEQQLFIRSFMRLDDPADPAAWNDLQECISEVDAEIEGIRKQEKQRAKLFAQGRYHVRIIESGKGKAHDWKKVIAVVDALVGEGIPPSNTAIRDMLVPVIDHMPEREVPISFQRVLAEIDRYLATQVPRLPDLGRQLEFSQEVQAVAERLADKVMVVIGGERRPHACEALKSAFRLKDLVWISTREHEAVDHFEPYVTRPEVDTVLLAIRWTSHSYGEVRDFCEKHGKRFVRLPAGYNPNQVAHQILQQQ